MERSLRIVALLLLSLAVLGGQRQASGTLLRISPAPYLAGASDPEVTTLAKDRKISIQEAQRRIGWQQPAVELGEELQRALGDRFGGLWIDPVDGGRVKVGIRGGATADARSLIARRQLTAVTDLVLSATATPIWRPPPSGSARPPPKPTGGPAGGSRQAW